MTTNATSTGTSTNITSTLTLEKPAITADETACVLGVAAGSDDAPQQITCNRIDHIDATMFYPQLDFPFVFYKFVNEVSQTHPEIVAWSTCGNYFQIVRNSKELPTLIGQHFHHSVYQSLRRQMNMYGFHLTDDVPPADPGSRTNWWSRLGGFFCRDSPQLHKIRPRRRPEKNSKTAAAATSSGNTNSIAPQSYTSPFELGQNDDASISDSPPTTLSSTTELIGKSTTDEKIVFGTSNESSEQATTEIVEAIISDAPLAKIVSTTNHENGWDGAVKGSNEKGKRLQLQLSQAFPELLHNFISKCAVSHPDVVQWNKAHTAFNVEIHHPELPDLLSQYFQHKNYSSLRRQLNFYGFRRDEEGFYRNEKFAEGRFENITSRAAKDRKRIVAKKSARPPQQEDKSKESASDTDDLSTLFDHDLSTYDTMKNDDVSFEQMDDKDLDNKSLDNEEHDSPQAIMAESLRKFNELDKVYVRDKDGVMYAAVIRRHLYGPQYRKQLDMGLVDSVEEATEKFQEHGDHELMWHYFVHFDYWNVTFDRWVSESEVYPMSDEVTATAQKISQEHRSLLQEMRKQGTKGKKSYQTVHGATFLKEWKVRLEKIREELDFDPIKDHTLENLQTVSGESDQSKRSLKKCFAWTKAALSTERKYRRQGLTGKRIPNVANGMTIPLVLKKVVVQQWEYINQCQMMPCIPAPMTIRKALDSYLESKNVSCTIPVVGTLVETTEMDSSSRTSLDESFAKGNSEEQTVNCDISAGARNNIDNTMETNDRIPAAMRDQEWRDMADGICMLFDESLESRLLYREELPQLRAIFCFSEDTMAPYSELYGCEHLLRLFIRLPEMIADNLPDELGRPIMVKVNDFIRFIHKNHSSLLTQRHRTLNESEKSEKESLEGEEKKRKNGDDSNIVPHKKATVGKKSID